MKKGILGAVFLALTITVSSCTEMGDMLETMASGPDNMEATSQRIISQAQASCRTCYSNCNVDYPDDINARANCRSECTESDSCRYGDGS